MSPERPAITVRVLTTYPRSDASRRLRIDPLVREFTRAGHRVLVHELFTERMFRNKNRGFFRRCGVVAALLVRLLARLGALVGRSTVLIVHREAFPFFTPAVERLAASRAELAVLDVDDAIYAAPSHGRDWRRFGREPGRARALAEVFDLILCGNPTLVEAFSHGRAEARLAPSCPPPSELSRHDEAESRVLWTGSQSTLPSLLGVLPEVLRACEELGMTLSVLGGANVASLPPHSQLHASEWSEDRERELLRACGIGIMPLPDTEWERGKSGYKAVLYLSAGMIAVVSPVGVNASLVARFDNAVAVTDDWAAALAEAQRRFRQHDERLEGAREARRAFDSVATARESYAAILARLASLCG